MAEIIYKELYNAWRNMPEPALGMIVTDVRCPTCGSTDMKYSAEPNDPREIDGENVRCMRCGYITDYYEAFKQYKTRKDSTYLLQPVNKPYGRSTGALMEELNKIHNIINNQNGNLHGN